MNTATVPITVGIDLKSLQFLPRLGFLKLILKKNKRMNNNENLIPVLHLMTDLVDPHKKHNRVTEAFLSKHLYYYNYHY